MWFLQISFQDLYSNTHSNVVRTTSGVRNIRKFAVSIITIHTVEMTVIYSVEERPDGQTTKIFDLVTIHTSLLSQQFATTSVMIHD